MRRGLGAVLSIVWAFGGSTSLGVEVASLTKGSGAAASQADAIRPLKETTEIVCMQGRKGARAPKVTVGMNLERGDRLTSSVKDLVLELECGDHVKRRLASPFDVIIDNPETCLIDLRGGNLEILAPSRTEINAGGVTLGNSSTEYALRVTAVPPRPRHVTGATGAPGAPKTGPVKVIVYDGRVKITKPKKKTVWTGKALSVDADGKLGSKVNIDPQDIAVSADIYARSDVGRAGRGGSRVPDPRETYERMKKLHTAVLSDPANIEARNALSSALNEVGLGDEAEYHRKAADRLKRSQDISEIFKKWQEESQREDDQKDGDEPKQENDDVVDLCAKLRGMLDRGNVKGIEAKFRNRREAKRPEVSCEYAVLARIHVKKDADQACKECGRALELATDGRLLDAEKDCSNICPIR